MVLNTGAVCNLKRKKKICILYILPAVKVGCSKTEWKFCGNAFF